MTIYLSFTLYVRASVCRIENNVLSCQMSGINYRIIMILTDIIMFIVCYECYVSTKNIEMPTTHPATILAFKKMRLMLILKVGD